MKCLCVAVLLASIYGFSQGSVQLNSTTDQVINQQFNLATPTNLFVNRFQQIRFADQFGGSDIGQKVNTAISDLGSGGGVVEIPAGNYSFSHGIVIDTSNVWIRCQGWGTILTFSSSGGTAVTIGKSGTTITGVKFSDCTLRGSGGSGSIGVNILGNTVSGNWVERINFDGGGTSVGFDTAIKVGDSGGTTGSAYNNYIEHNLIQLNPNSTTGSQVGIDVQYKAHNLNILGNIIQNSGSSGTSTVGIKVANSSSVKIKNNDVESCSTNIQVGVTSSGTFQAQGTQISNNYLEIQSGNSNSLDVEVGPSSIGTVIEGNFEQGSGANYLIQVDDQSIGTVIANNTEMSPSSAVVHNATTSSYQSSIAIYGNRTNVGSYIDSNLWVTFNQDPTSGMLSIGALNYSGFSSTSPANGTLIYCKDCAIAASCSATGNGALAKRINGSWVCN